MNDDDCNDQATNQCDRSYSGPASPTQKRIVRTPWTLEKFTQAWDHLPQWPIVRDLLVEMAHCPTDQLNNLIPDIALPPKIKRQTLWGWLSLVNESHKDYRHKPRFFHYSWATDTYSMPPEIASLILQVELRSLL